MKNLYLILVMLFAGGITAQNVVTGKLIDEQNDEPLIGATVIIKGTTTGTVAFPFIRQL